MTLTSKERRELKLLREIREKNPAYFTHRFNQLLAKEMQDATGSQEEANDDDEEVTETETHEEENETGTHKAQARRILGGKRIDLPRTNR